ncbi:MAG: hypothetical protein ABI688_09870 [Bacteroidota bacterium]
MNDVKKPGGRIAYFIGGVVMTALGCFLIYFQFKEQRHYANSGSWPSYPFIILILGLASFAVAFSKNKKPGTSGNSNDPKQEDQYSKENQSENRSI